MAEYTREQALYDLGEVLAGLQVPVSMGMPLGTATEPWRRLKNATCTLGWKDPSDFVEGLRHILDGGETVSEGDARRKIAAELEADLSNGVTHQARWGNEGTSAWIAGFKSALSVVRQKRQPRVRV